jgi:hypothetical protein
VLKLAFSFIAFLCAAACVVVETAERVPEAPQASKTFNAEQQVVSSTLASRLSAAGYAVREASSNRFVADVENANVTGQVMFGTRGSDRHALNRLECSLSRLSAKSTSVACRGGALINAGNAFEKIAYVQNVSAIQSSLEKLARDYGW